MKQYVPTLSQEHQMERMDIQHVLMHLTPMKYIAFAISAVIDYRKFMSAFGLYLPWNYRVFFLTKSRINLLTTVGRS